ncbi:hypothetical protein B7Y94_01330 [Candidatus Saccharibacteria bacterium 32-49-12]|nr:MAG: hypothetical protein B7Y94_01330 [Candidatus Saccharibacteria bacterium 32-49-12]
MDTMFDTASQLIDNSRHIVVVQAENPDADSLGSALAIEEILSNDDRQVNLFCAIDIPKYLHYIQGWDRVEKDWPKSVDLIILVDTASETLLTKTFSQPGIRHHFEVTPILVIDHHVETEGQQLGFDHSTLIDSSCVATGELIYKLASSRKWIINSSAAESLFLAIQSDSLGLTTPNTTAESYRIAADLVALGANPSDIENRRREYMKKPADILSYKAKLIEKINYELDGRLATVHITWDEIEEYSDRYNPGALIIDEMRLVEGVDIAVAIKTYPDGKITGKLRSNIPISQLVAGYFGGGGHQYSAGFKIYEDYDTIYRELIDSVTKALDDYDNQAV